MDNNGIQHQDAVTALEIIIDAYKEHRVLTYTQLAEMLGKPNPKDHARAMGAVCDKLDAVSCFARMPQLALAVVREESGHVNRKAWHKEGEAYQEQVVDCAVHHRYSEAEFAAMRRILNLLSDVSNSDSWARAYARFTPQGVLARVTGCNADFEINPGN